MLYYKMEVPTPKTVEALEHMMKDHPELFGLDVILDNKLHIVVHK